MILAAGLGTRLRPLTNDRPKALVEIGGRTLLEIALARLRSFDIREVIINAHHLASMIAEYLKINNNFGMQIEVSHEDILLDTGGGLKKAAPFFLRPSSPVDEPFLLHNVDVISAIDLRRMVQFHREHEALATLAVQARKSSRYLLFDRQLRLCGRRFLRENITEWARPSPPPESSGEEVRELAFAGIHVISPRFLTMMTEPGAFSILASYLRLAGSGEKILAFPADEYYWRDLGTPESLAQAAQELSAFKPSED
jgi:NDP-sugar pyrophosphorylase family protein